MGRTGQIAHNAAAANPASGESLALDAARKSSVSSLLVFAAAGAALAGAGILTRNWLRQPPAAPLLIDASAAPSEILIGDVIEFPIKLTNASAASDLEISETHLSCGCTTVLHPVSRLSGGDSAALWLRTEVDEGRRRMVGSDITITLEKTNAVKASFTAKVVPPFDGWPDAAHATAASTGLRIAMDPAYAGRVKSARAFHVDDNSEITGVTLLPDSNCIAIPSVENRQVDLVVLFSPSIRWAGPLKVGVPLSRSR